MIRVLFVCLGNICRSTMAEAVFQQRVREAGLSDQISTDSAGTGAWHLGNPPHPKTLQILEKYHVTGYQHLARQIQGSDVQEFDYILTMDHMNYKDVERMFPYRSSKLMPLLHFAPHLQAREVPDPYYDGRYEEVYALVTEACRGLLDHLREEIGQEPIL